MDTIKTITVKVKYETEVEIDVTDLSPEFVDIEGFAYEEAYRMIEDDLEHGYISANDMEFEIIKKN